MEADEKQFFVNRVAAPACVADLRFSPVQYTNRQSHNQS
jgi:hypothetical protein